MIREIRIYYESIEQAYHYVCPIVCQAVKELHKEIEVKLVKLAKDYSYYSKRLAPILFWKEPDILLSVIQNNEEYPILLIEFSTAVFTEDHELQRFDGMLAAAKNNCLYIKISPTKKESPYDHGGKTEFDYTQPFRLIYSKYKKPYFHFEWTCDERGVVETDPEYLSCPKRIPEFEVLLKNIIKEIIENGYSPKWIDNVCNKLREHNYFKAWLNKLKTPLEVKVSALNTSRTHWIKEDPILNSAALEVKLNRFGHAMDPERGMLAYYGTLTSNVISKMVFSRKTDAWFKDIPKEKEIRSIVNKGLKSLYDFLLCFALGSGLYASEEFMNIIKEYKDHSGDHIIIDLTNFIRENFYKLSKPLKTIFCYSKLFVIEDDDGKRKVIFKWEPFQEMEAYKYYPKITPIKRRNILDEDDVTYIVVHNILKLNGFKIIAVSYPGAQGDRRILIQAGTGRRQPRKYIDVISFLPNTATTLEENKGVYNAREIQSDIDELSLYKRDETYKKGLRNFLELFAPEALGTPIKIGVGFWASKSFNISAIKNLDLKDLDYFIYITRDRKQWYIWRSGEDNIFSITSGSVSLPITYQVVQRKNLSEDLLNFL